MKHLTKFKIFWYVTWTLSAVALFYGLVFVGVPDASKLQKTVANLSVQIGGSFFFALTVGWVVDKIRNAQGYSVLWEFGQEFRRAGIMAFYSDREGEAKKSLEKAFEKHRKGEVLISGASLRFFLAPSGHLYYRIHNMLKNKDNSVKLRALFCSPEDNHELPVRSFVEEFNQDGSFSTASTFNWEVQIEFPFKDFEKSFFAEHGISAPPEKKLRVIGELEQTRMGVRYLKGIATHTPNSIAHREIRFSPYCTTVIFPDKAFYTPNLLCTEVPVNLPMIEFHKSSDVYKKLLQYFEFLWWVSKPEDKKEEQDA